jgi:LCP family protein required for cell wall assembly
MNWKKWIAIGVTVVTTALLIVFAVTAIQAYRAPLAPAMDLPAAAEPKAVEPVAGAGQTQQPICGQTGSMMILFIGSDTSFGEPPYGADSVRLIKADFDAQKVVTVAFPRDLIVDSSALEDPAMLTQRLGLTFHYAYQAATGTRVEKNSAAASVLAQVMVDNFEVVPEYYLALEMDNVAPIVDTLGGVELTVPQSLTSPRNITFPAGKQTLSGALATEYVRLLDKHGESARIARQNDFAKALQAKIMKVSVLPKLPTLLEQFKDAVITDLSPEQLVSLACLAEKMPKGQVTYGALDTPNLVENNIPKKDAVIAYLDRLFGGK